MKKNLAILISLILWFSIAETSGQTTKQKKLIADDSNTLYKADTSLVIVNDSAFQKIISVRYKYINEEILSAEYLSKAEQVRQQLANEKQNRERATAEIERLKAELEAEKTFYRTAAKDLKFATKKTEGIETKKASQQKQNEERIQKIEIRDNPPRKSQ